MVAKIFNKIQENISRSSENNNFQLGLQDLLDLCLSKTIAF